MSDDTMVQEFPDEKKRRAICEKQWEKGIDNMKNKFFKSPFKRGQPGYEVQNKVNAPTEIYIYDEIGFFGVDAQTFVQDLKAIDGDVLIRINSPGGSVFDGMAIYNAITERKEKTDTIVDGLAASAASYIALAGDSVSMSEGAFLMIHEPWSLVIGAASDMRKEADLLDKVNDQIAGFFTKKSERSLSEVKQKMVDETWFTGSEAKEFGLVDEIVEQVPAENLFDLSVFNNVPESLVNSFPGDMPARKDIEQALRQAGLSKSEARAFYANGKVALDHEEIEEDDIWAMMEQLKHTLKE